MPISVSFPTAQSLQSVANALHAAGFSSGESFTGNNMLNSYPDSQLQNSILVDADAASAQSANLGRTETAVANAPRRSYRLTSLFEKQTCAIYIRGEDKSVTPTNLDFYTTSVQENSQEKMQIVENFNDFNVYFFGQKPMLWTFGGIMRNDQYNNWSNEFDVSYHANLRGTQLAKTRRRIIFTYDNAIIEGYIVQMGKNKSAGTDRAVSFSLMFLVTDFKQLFFAAGEADLKISQTTDIETKEGISTSILVDGQEVSVTQVTQEAGDNVNELF